MFCYCDTYLTRKYSTLLHELEEFGRDNKVCVNHFNNTCRLCNFLIHSETNFHTI